MGILIDCSSFDFNLNNTMQLCNNEPEMMLFAPTGRIVSMLEHEMMEQHSRVPMEGEISPEVLAKKIRDQIPDLIQVVEEEYDLHQFLDKIQTKVIYFEENLLKPHYLKKLAIVYQGRIDFAICDSRELMAKFRECRSGWGNIVLMEYDQLKEEYQRVVYTGDTNFENNPFQEVNQWLGEFVFPTRDRDILVDF